MYDRRHTVRGLDAVLRAAVAGWWVREPDAFQPPLPGDGAGSGAAA
ncbi:hypothetical protein OHA72_46910 [Dactylosporangium sp. NBC_01737]|nr:hypothetical protein OHA72_46910 [Dactylosporangium sp. NBC_01737]